jgi:predicted DNA-binding WGR domain protein
VRVFPKSLFVTWGRLGTEGQWQSKEYQQRGEASAAADKLIAEKLAKGYVRAAGRPPREE